MTQPRLTVTLIGCPVRTYVLTDQQARSVERLFRGLLALATPSARGAPIAEILRSIAPAVADDFERPDASGEMTLEDLYLGGLVSRKRRLRFSARPTP